MNQESDIPPAAKLDNAERDHPSSSVSLPRGANQDGIDPNFVLFSPSDRSPSSPYAISKTIAANHNNRSDKSQRVE